MWTFGLSVLTTIARKQHITDFVLYDWSGRDSILCNMLGGLTPNQSVRFTTARQCTLHGEYTDEFGDTYSCIRLSASGEH